MKTTTLAIAYYLATSTLLLCNDAYEYGRVSIIINPPTQFVRIDDSATDIAAIAKACTPAGNHLFAAYADKSSLFGRTGGHTPSPYPYFMLQVSKKAAQEGIKGGTIKDLFDLFADKVGNNNEINANSNEVEAIRKRIQAAASARTPGIITNTPTASPIGILDRDSRHITILMAGVSSNTYQGKTENINVLTTMTVLDISGIPMFVYVYDIYDNPSALAKIKLLTQQIVSSISPNL